MKKINNIVSMLLLFCLILNTAVSDLAFGQKINLYTSSDKLSAPSRVDDIMGIEPKDIGDIEMWFAAYLVYIRKMSGDITIETLKKFRDNGNRPGDTMSKVPGTRFFIDEAKQISDDIIKIKVQRKDSQNGPRKYYIEYSPGARQARVYPEGKKEILIARQPSILEAAEINIKAAAEGMNLHPFLLEKILTPKRVTTVKFEVMLDSDEKETLWAFRALQNDARGPGKGGLRWLIGRGETLEEAKKTAVGLATFMSAKNAVIGIPYGGGKGDVFVGGHKYTDNDKARIMRAFSRELTKENAIGTFIDVPAPDKGTDARMMAWFLDEHLAVLTEDGLIHDKTIEKELKKVKPSKDPQATSYLDKYIRMLEEDEDGILQGFELGMVTGKPALKGGSEGRTKATGFGGFLALKGVLKYLASVKDLSTNAIGRTLNDKVKALLGKDLSQMTAAIQGTGNVGEYNAWELFNAGTKIIMLQDAVEEDGKFIQYTLYDPTGKGINIELLNKNLERLPDGRWAPLKTLPRELLEREGYKLLRDDAKYFWTIHTDIKVPAATENVITTENVADVNCEILLELANDPTTPEAHKALQKMGALVIPDIFANSGGVTVSYYEWLQNIEGKYLPEACIDKMLEGRMDAQLQVMIALAEKYQVDLREAAFRLYVARTVDAEIARDEELSKAIGDEKPYDGYGELGLFPDTIEELNSIVKDGQLDQLIKESEKAKSLEIDAIADQAVEKLPQTEIGFVLIAGPSTSGKLGLAFNLANRLSSRGRRAIRLNFDELTVNHIKKLKYGEEIEAVDYIDGKRVSRKIKPEKGDVLVVEGSHALSDEVVGMIPGRNRLGVFVNTAPSMKLADNWPLTSLDLRLLRNIITINHMEGKEAIDIIRGWPAERIEQLKYIYPTWVKADVTFNSYLAYELPIIKFYVEGLIRKARDVAVESNDESSIRIIERLEKTLKGVTAVEAPDSIPPDSMSRQYIGKEFYEGLAPAEFSAAAYQASMPTAVPAIVSSEGPIRLEDIMKLVPAEWLDGWLNIEEMVKVLKEAGCAKDLVTSDDKSVLIFSEKATFGEYKDKEYEEGLGVILPSLAKSGVKIAVVGTTDKQKALIDELNEDITQEKRIVYAGSVEEVMEKAKESRYYYFKVESDAEVNGVTSITIIVKKIIEAIGKVTDIVDSKLINQMHEAARRFAIAA